jgi:hypothetical protein
MAKRITKAERIMLQLNEVKGDRKSVTVVGFIYDDDMAFSPQENPRWEVSGQTGPIKHFMFQVLDDIAEKEKTDLATLCIKYLSEKKVQEEVEPSDRV